jgi:hypothetical protein
MAKLKFRKGSTDFVVGNVYTYDYRPITANQMNFFDTRPLIVFMGYNPKGRTMYGINLHFMNLQYRRAFLNHIDEFRKVGVDVNGINSMLAVRLRWKYLKARPHIFGYVNVAIRQYRLDRIKNLQEVNRMTLATEILKNPKQNFRGYVTLNMIAGAIKMAMRGASWKEWSSILPTKKILGEIRKNGIKF